MSTKLRIRIKKLVDPELDLKLNYGTLIRLSILIQFKTKSGWGKPYEAILDTGAHTSVIPEYIWKGIDVEEKADHRVQGIIPKKECSLPVTVGIVKGRLFDEELNCTKEIGFYAYCAFDDGVPLILGFKDLLDKFPVYFDIKSDEAYLG